MKAPQRKYGPLSQVFIPKALPTGHVIYVPYVDDLTDTELQQAMEHWLECEDYEYCQHLSAEADRRNLKLNM